MEVLKSDISETNDVLAKENKQNVFLRVGAPTTYFDTKISGDGGGVTFLITGAMIPCSSYKSIINLLQKNKSQHVICIYTNVLIGRSHREYAKIVVKEFDEYNEKHKGKGMINEYSIVGHSAGAKIALLVISLYDFKRVKTVIALDAVDEMPVEFTSDIERNMKTTERNFEKKKKHHNLNLSESNAKDIILTQTSVFDAGISSFNREHSPEAIHELNVAETKLIHHEGAGHMAYTDDGGGMLAKMMMLPSGDKEANEKAFQGAHDLIEQYIDVVKSVDGVDVDSSITSTE